MRYGWRKTYRRTVKFSFTKQPKPVLAQSSNKSKLSPHKKKKNPYYTNPKFLQLAPNKSVWQLSHLSYLQHLQPSIMVLSNALGCLSSINAVLGFSVNQVFKWSVIGGNQIFTPQSLLVANSLPLVYINDVVSRQSFSVFSSQSTIVNYPSGSQRHLSGVTAVLGVKSPVGSPHRKVSACVVRGIAKNPVDHPNGGRANTKGSFKTPWGAIAKKNK